MLTKNDIATSLGEIIGWELQENPVQLVKKFEFKGYYKTISFVNAVAWLANQHNHHPELLVTFNSCTVHLTTHDEGGITSKDTKLIIEIEKLLS